MIGHDVAGATVATGCVVSLASIFVLGKNSQQKELAAKQRTRDNITKSESPEAIERDEVKPARATPSKQPPKKAQQRKSKG